MEDLEYWIYHERQQAMLCGQHALNNLVQECKFTPQGLAQIAGQLDQMELQVMAQNNEGGVNSKDYLARLAEGSHNVDGSGNFSIEVLRAALRAQYNLELPNIRQEGLADKIDVTEMEGFICNKESHWFAIRLINGRFWNLNSMKERPEKISHFNLAKEIQSLQQSGYSVFVVPVGLPPPCTSKSQRSRGTPEFWWKEDDLVKMRGSAAVNGATDPWKDVGSGNRLDGKSSSALSQQIGDLTEEEMIQMALAASMKQTSESTPDILPALTEEPEQGTKDVVRIQFRLPGGNRAVRRFSKSDPVRMLYSFAESESNGGQGRKLELRYGFPPKDLYSLIDRTLSETNLAGESIQCRFL